MLGKFFRTDGSDCSAFLLRVILGIVMLPHGLQKTLGLFGGAGFSGTMQMFTEGMGIPWALALCAVLAESLGAIGLIAGCCTRLCAFAIGTVMVVAVAMFHWRVGMFMDWSGQQGAEGFEFHLLAIGIALALMIRGGGKWSCDEIIASKV